MTRPSSLEYALLGLLRYKPQSGYDLRKVFATTPMRHFSDSPGSIYPALRRLHARGWVRSSAARDSARQRQPFALTGDGKRALVGWLQAPITRDDVVWRLDQTILRFALLDGNVERRVTARFLQAFEKELSAYILELEEHLKAFSPASKAGTSYLAFTFGLESYRANLEWARRARKQVMEALR